MRLDIYLTKHYNIQSRNKAHELIKAKKIKINGAIITKPSYNIEDINTNLEILEDTFYVSRSAYKLKYFLEDFSSIKLENLHALDIGSSTGGFTQILLEHNVAAVTCVDVGSNQLHSSIKDNDKIIIKENTDIRNFSTDIKYDLISCDVSFISIHNILNNINNLAKDKIIILFKPQFEVGKDTKRNKAGVVQDQRAIITAREQFMKATQELQWKLVFFAPSKVPGKEGNCEELFYFTKYENNN